MKPWQNTAVQNCKFDVSSLLLNLLERLYKILYYLGDAPCCSVVVFDESGCSALYHFEILDTMLRCGEPMLMQHTQGWVLCQGLCSSGL